MSENGGFLDMVWDDPISRRGLSIVPHPQQVVLSGFTVTPIDNPVFDIEIEATRREHPCRCWKCHPEDIPEKQPGVVSIRRAKEELLKPRFWKTTLDGKPCGFVKEALPGKNGYVWMARTPPHACSCGSHYACTIVVYGNVTVEGDGDDYT